MLFVKYYISLSGCYVIVNGGNSLTSIEIAPICVKRALAHISSSFIPSSSINNYFSIKEARPLLQEISVVAHRSGSTTNSISTYVQKTKCA